MQLVIGVLLIWVMFLAFDVWLYCRTKWPQRSYHWWAYLPGGGFAVYLKYGGDK